MSLSGWVCLPTIYGAMGERSSCKILKNAAAFSSVHIAAGRRVVYAMALSARVESRLSPERPI